MADEADGAEIRSWREAAGIERRVAAEMAGVGHRRLQRIERGQRPVPPGLADWLRRVYAGEARGWRPPR